MTLLRRAPREVYRVYGEDEFWASAALEPFDGWSRNGRASAIRPSSGRRTLLRTAASTVLLASVGTVGGLMAMTGAAPFPHAGRGAVASLLARERSPASSQAAGVHIWRERVRSPRSPASRVRVARSRLLARRLIVRGLAPGPSEPASASRAASTIEPDHEGAAVEVAAVSLPSHAAAPAPVESPARTVGSTPAGQSPPGPAEFGFER